MRQKKLAGLFAAFSDETRLKILILLLDGEFNVSEIADNCDLSLSNTSHQLKYLKEKKLIKFRKQGKYAYYSLDDEHVQVIIKYGLEHINEY